MNKREFLKISLGLVGLSTFPIQSAAAINSKSTMQRLLIQRSPLAGFQYYQGEAIWSQLRTKQVLRLKREAENGYDSRAVAVYRKQEKLGYLPRRENTAVSQMLDQGERLVARIVSLQQSRDPWARIELDVWHLTQYV